MRHFLPVLILLAAAVPASAQSYALALELPKEGVSFWRLHDKTAWGLELDCDLRWIKDSTNPYQGSSNLEERSLGLGLVFQRSQPFRSDLAPFWFARLDGFHDAADLPPEEREPTVPRFTEWDMGMALGVGVSWQPFERVAVWVRQGLRLSANVWKWKSHPDVEIHPEPAQNSLRLGLQSPVVLAVFSW